MEPTVVQSIVWTEEYMKLKKYEEALNGDMGLGLVYYPKQYEPYIVSYIRVVNPTETLAYLQSEIKKMQDVNKELWQENKRLREEPKKRRSWF